MSADLHLRQTLEMFEEGAAGYLGTRDAALVPDATFLSGASLSGEPDVLTVYVPIAPSRRALENLRANGAAAITAARLSDYRTLQLKGRMRAIRDARPEERVLVERQHEAFARGADFDELGHVVRSWVVWPCVAVDVEVTDVFAQTPGPGAGRKVSR